MVITVRNSTSGLEVYSSCDRIGPDLAEVIEEVVGDYGGELEEGDEFTLSFCEIRWGSDFVEALEERLEGYGFRLGSSEWGAAEFVNERGAP